MTAPHATIILDGVAYSLCGGRIFSCGIDAAGQLLWHERRPESEACGKIYTTKTLRGAVLALHARKQGVSA